MPISFACPGCKKTLRVADKLAGKRAKCPGCQTPVTIPNTSPSTPASTPPPAAEKKPASEWEFGLAPLQDEVFPKPVPAAQKPATPAKTTTPARTVPLAEEVIEQDFQLQPLANLESDLLNQADPLGQALPLTAALPNQANPYLAPQTHHSSANVIQGSLPIWKTTKECLKKYSDNYGYSFLFGLKAAGVLMGVAAVAYAVFFLLGKFFETAQPSIDLAYSIFWIVVVLLGICWFLVQCWLAKGLLYFGYSIAKEDYSAAESALNSPGSLLQFIFTSIGNTVVFVVLWFGLSWFVTATHWGMALPALILLSLVVNLLSMNLMFYFEFEANCVNVFGYWSRIIAPHYLKFGMIVVLCTLIGLIIQILLLVGVAMAYAALQHALIGVLSSDPRIVSILLGSVFYAVVFGVFGSYYSIMQGVCFRKMLRLYRRSQDED